MNDQKQRGFSPYYDLAAEAGAILRGKTNKEIPGVTEKITEKEGLRLSAIAIKNDTGASLMKRPKGNYITLEVHGDPGSEQTKTGVITELSAVLRDMLPKEDDLPVLICGIGNPDIASDALGEETVKRILPTRHFFREDPSWEIEDIKGFRPTALFCPNVLGNTGMEALELIRAVAKEIRPCAVLVIDALATASGERLGTSFQVTDTGLHPGGGIGNHRPGIDASACGVPVIALGVPTVIYPYAIVSEVFAKLEARDPDLFSSLPQEEILNEVMSDRLLSCAVTPKDIDATVKTLAEILSCSIQTALHTAVTAKNCEEYLPRP